MRVDELLDRLDGVRRNGAGWKARCPAHDDRAPSLSIHEGDDGRILLKCFAGCEIDAILAGLNLKPADLFASPTTSGAKIAWETRYAIRATPDAEPYFHVRQDLPDGTKRMWWERANGAKGLGGVPLAELPLYGIDRLNGARGVIVTEGEKAAEALLRLGLPAVGTVTGADGTPGNGTLRAIADRVVVLWPDRDGPGERHMLRIAAKLSALGCQRVRLVEWPDAPAKGDAADFIARGASADDVRALTKTAKAFDPAIPDPDPLGDRDREGTPEPLRIWERTEPKPRRYVVDGLIPLDAITSLYGDGGSGKSLLVLYLGTCVTLGRSFLDRTVMSGPVLYVDAELDADEFTRRAYRVARGMGRDRPPADLYYYRLAGSLYDPQNVALVQGMVDEIAPALVVLDSVMAASYGADLERANDTTLTMKAIERWGTVLGIDHIAKPMPGANLSQYRQYGSVFKYNLSRSVLQVIQADGGGLTLRQTKHNFGPKAEPLLIGMDFDPDRVTFARLNPDDDRLSGIEDNLPAVERVLRELNFHPEGAMPADLADALGIAEKTVRNHLTTLKQRMRAASDEHGRWFPIPDPYRSQEPGTHTSDGRKP